jgi:hypothetical protein
MQIDITALF